MGFNILSPQEAANLLGISKSTLYKWTSERKIPFYKLNGKKIGFKKSELEEWINSSRIAPVDEVLTSYRKGGCYE